MSYEFAEGEEMRAAVCKKKGGGQADGRVILEKEGRRNEHGACIGKKNGEKSTEVKQSQNRTPILLG